MSITKTDIFKRLDRQMKKIERIELACAYDLSDYHLGLGLWIRNTWFNKPEIRALFITELDDFHIGNRDEFSSNILREYQAYLRDKYKLDKYDILTPTSDLWNAMVSLNVDKCEQLLRSYEIDANMTYDGFSQCDKEDIIFNPIHTIVMAWDILTTKNPCCQKWYDKNQEIKNMLSDKFGIDFARSEESDTPTCVVKKCSESVLDYLIKELSKKDVLQISKIDINLYMAVALMDVDTVKKLLAEGADPRVKIIREKSALDICNSCLNGLEHFETIISNSVPDDYPQMFMFTDWIWSLMQTASYQELLDMLSENEDRP